MSTLLLDIETKCVKFGKLGSYAPDIVYDTSNDDILSAIKSIGNELQNKALILCVPNTFDDEFMCELSHVLFNTCNVLSIQPCPSEAAALGCSGRTQGLMVKINNDVITLYRFTRKVNIYKYYINIKMNNMDELFGKKMVLNKKVWDNIKHILKYWLRECNVMNAHFINKDAFVLIYNYYLRKYGIHYMIHEYIRKVAGAKNKKDLYKNVYIYGDHDIIFRSQNNASQFTKDLTKHLCALNPKRKYIKCGVINKSDTKNTVWVGANIFGRIFMTDEYKYYNKNWNNEFAVSGFVRKEAGNMDSECMDKICGVINKYGLYIKYNKFIQFYKSKLSA